MRLRRTSSVKCFNGNDGSATANPAGGNPPYTFTWSTNPAQATATATGLTAGNYSVTVSDTNGWCSSTSNASISQTSSVNPNAIITDASACSASDGRIGLSTSGGTPTYSYAWSNGSTNAINSGLIPGSYTLTIKDGKGCISSSVHVVNCATGVQSINSQIDFAFFPNPTTGVIYISLPENTLKIIVTDVLGRKINFSSSQTILGTVSINLSSVPTGIYLLRVKTKEGFSVKKLIKE